LKIADALPVTLDGTLPDGSEAHILTDPLTQQPYRQDTPPRYLLEDAKMKRGFDYLEAYGDRLEVSLLLAGHSKREDLTRNHFEQRLADSDYYAHEGHSQIRERRLMRLGRIGMGNEYDQYHRQVLDHSPTPSFSYDLSVGRVGRMLLGYQNSHRKQLVEDWGKYLPYEFIREWQWVPTFGYQMSRLNRAPQRNLRVLMTAGLMHRDLERKLGLYDVSVAASATTEGYPAEKIKFALAKTACMQTGVISK